jgi:ketosteroid isomerase-like protein
MTKADENAIRDIELRFNEAWGRHDADGMVESLTDDAQFVTVNGAWTTNRADYLDLMQRLHGADGPFRLSTRRRPRCICVFSRRTSR